MRFLLLLSFALFSVAVSAQDEVISTGRARGLVNIELLGCQPDGQPTVNLFGIPYYRGIVLDGPCQVVEDNRLMLGPVAIPPELFDFASGHYALEIVGGPRAGHIAGLVSLDADGYLVADRELTNFAAGDRVRVLELHSLFSIFGEHNDFGLKPGPSPEVADEIILHDAETQATRVFYFSSEHFGWTEAGADEWLAGDIPLLPQQALMVRRKEAETVRILVAGISDAAVLTARVRPGINLMANLRTSDETGIATLGGRLGVATPAKNPATRHVNFDASAVPEARSAPIVGTASRSQTPSNDWMAALGLSPNEPLNIVNDSAVIVTASPEESARTVIIRR